jgi:hypothetical protein
MIEGNYLHIFDLFLCIGCYWFILFINIDDSCLVICVCLVSEDDI